jgi:Tfp pilus assembly protein PilF
MRTHRINFIGRQRTCGSMRWIAALGLSIVSVATAAPTIPTRDDEVVEHLPTRVIGLRPLSASMQPATTDLHDAAMRARSLLNDARDRGDPRYAGYALAAVAPWTNDAKAPPEIVVLLATLAQYQHDFDGARRMLDGLLARTPNDAQALLTLATIARVQGRYDDSDVACRRVPVGIYAAACVAENLALRGRYDDARKTLASLMSLPLVPGKDGDGVRLWLTTTLAELEQRAGHVDATRKAFASALAFGRDAYLKLDYADFLLEQKQTAEVIRLLGGEPRPYGDGVLLRLAIAARMSGAANATAYADDLRERFAAARERGDAISIHGRELARFIDVVEGKPRVAIAVARDNLRIQKEPADFLVMAHAARAAGDQGALAEVVSSARRIGLVDSRLDGLAGAP